MMLKCLVIAAALVAACQAKSVVTDCGGPDAYIKFDKLDITPMPINILGKIKVEGEVETLTKISNDISLSVNLRKSNLGGAFTWELPCTNIGAIVRNFTGYLGTCDYKGSCDFPLIKDWVANKACPDFFTEYKIPCECPFPKKKFATTEAVEVDLGRFEDYLPAWLIEGGYTADVKLRDTTLGNKLVGCVTFKFEAVRKPCPDVLKELNACP